MYGRTNKLDGRGEDRWTYGRTDKLDVRKNGHFGCGEGRTEGSDTGR